jgi:hypothetical protein
MSTFTIETAIATNAKRAMFYDGSSHPATADYDDLYTAASDALGIINDFLMHRYHSRRAHEELCDAAAILCAALHHEQPHHYVRPPYLFNEVDA